jgi:hypothetical protein
LTTAAQEKAQANRDTIFVEDGEVVSIDAFPGEQFIMRIVRRIGPARKFRAYHV